MSLSVRNTLVALILIIQDDSFLFEEGTLSFERYHRLSTANKIRLYLDPYKILSLAKKMGIPLPEDDNLPEEPGKNMQNYYSEAYHEYVGRN